jgi:hypothetical protein
MNGGGRTAGTTALPPPRCRRHAAAVTRTPSRGRCHEDAAEYSGMRPEAPGSGEPEGRRAAGPPCRMPAASLRAALFVTPAIGKQTGQASAGIGGPVPHASEIAGVAHGDPREEHTRGSPGLRKRVYLGAKADLRLRGGALRLRGGALRLRGGALRLRGGRLGQWGGRFRASRKHMRATGRQTGASRMEIRR